jgi:hypothetical protein
MSRRGGRIHGGAKAAAIIDQDWLDGSEADNMPLPMSDAEAAQQLSQDHPKSKPPAPLHSFGMAMDANTARTGTSVVEGGANQGRPGIGVGGAVPIGALAP